MEAEYVLDRPYLENCTVNASICDCSYFGVGERSNLSHEVKIRVFVTRSHLLGFWSLCDFRAKFLRAYGGCLGTRSR